VPAGALAGSIVGDWYLDSANGDYYEKTATTTWTLRGNLKGATGATGSTGIQGNPGTPGEKWFTGAGAPAGATGIVGDWYLDSVNGDYYEKTASATWTLRGNLKGATGATGPASTVPGPAGPQGTAGTPGEKWFSGTGPPDGALGIVGDWYIDMSIGDFYEKTGAAAWTGRGNLKGATGAQGIQGIQGPVGPGVPVGGNPGERLVKAGGADFNTVWQAGSQLNADSATGLSTTVVAPTEVMTGWGVLWTPRKTGLFLVVANCRTQHTVANAFMGIRFRYGAGAAVPALGAAATGTGMAQPIYSPNYALANGISPICFATTGGPLTVGTQYWISTSFWNQSAGTGTLHNCWLSFIEF
jgi:hypothetical protein